MNKAELLLIIEDIEKNTEEIYRISNQIKTFSKRLPREDFKGDQLQLLYENIQEILGFWTGNTYVGQEKAPKLKKALQQFFENLMDFIHVCQNVNIDFLNDFANKALYQGTLYRYLGHSIHENCDETIEPIYDDFYVSWSKNPRNSYIESKLCGTMTHLTCEVSGDYYGIDLSAFGVVRGEEAEVVFPTIEGTIVKKKYLTRYSKKDEENLE